MSEVKCKLVEHETCIKCGSLEPTMVKIGVFTMCPTCWQKEFNQTDIPITSPEYKVYQEWLKETEYSR